MRGHWTKDTALKELRDLADATLQLARERHGCAEHTRWLANALATLEDVFGRESRFYAQLASFAWREQRDDMIYAGLSGRAAAMDRATAMERMHQDAYREQLESARGLLLAAADQLERTDLDSVYKGKDTGPEASAILRGINLAQHKLRKIMRSEPAKEIEVQDAFESLLIGADIPFSREAEHIEYSSKGYVPDFTVPKLDLAIDVKLCNRDDREKEIIAEINDDILAYQTRYGNALFVVYDVGQIRDVDRFKSSFESHENVVVVVVKH